MKRKDIVIGIFQKALVISVILLLILSLTIMPTPDSVVRGATTIDIELETGWNFLGMPESISASDLALKSKHITNIVHMGHDGYYESYIPSLGATDFICGPNEAIYIYSNAVTTLTFTIYEPAGDISGDLFVTGDTILNKNLMVNGSMSVVGDLKVNSLNVTEDLTVDGDLTVNKNLAVGEDLTISGSLIVGEDLTVGELIVTEDITINDDLDVRRDATIGGNSTVEENMIINGDLSVAGDSTIGGDALIAGNLTAGDFTVDNLSITEDLSIDGNLSVTGDAMIGGDTTVAGDAIITGNLTAGDFTVGNLTITEDLTIGGNLSVAGDSKIGGDSTVAGDMVVAGNLTAGDFTVGNLTIAEDLAINGNLSVAGDTMIGGDAIIAGNLTAGDFTVGNLTITEDFTVGGNLTVNGDLNVGGSLSYDDLSITGDLTVGGNISVAGDITGATGRTATFTIAASNSNPLSKNQADYVCDGTNDEEELQNALDAISTTGGRIVLMEGNYYWSSAPTYYSNIIVEGQGAGTVIVLNADIVPFNFHNIERSTIRDLDVSVTDGHTEAIIETISDGATGKVIYCTFENIFIRNDYGEPNHNYTGIRVKMDNSRYQYMNTYENIYMDWCKKGIHIQAIDGSTWMNGNLFEKIMVWGYETFIDFDKSVTATNIANRNTFIDVKCQTRPYSIDGVKNIQRNGNIFIDCLVWDWWVADNPNYAWSISADARDTVIIGSAHGPSSPDVLDESPDTEWIVPGAVDNSGTATVSNESWISHGLGVVPSIIILTAYGPEDVWILVKNDTQFQVGVETGSVQIDWYVKV